LYGQCGGSGWQGATDCCDGATCQYGNEWYSQCLPGPTAPTTTTTPSSGGGGGDRQNGVTTRYWDCCKASCGWAGKASVSEPVLTCQKDGVTAAGVNEQSGCNGGPAYMCNNQQPWSISANLSYGYAAAHIAVCISAYKFISMNDHFFLLLSGKRRIRLVLCLLFTRVYKWSRCW